MSNTESWFDFVMVNDQNCLENIYPIDRFSARGWLKYEGLLSVPQNHVCDV